VFSTGPAARGSKEGFLVAVRIFVDGSGSEEMKRAVRAALGPRPEEEAWLVSLIQHRFTWGACVLASPGDRLARWNFFGSRAAIGPALKDAVKKAGLERLERRVRDLPHTPERRGNPVPM
jgi:hypothetical protein